MLNIQGYTNLINSKERPKLKKRWDDVYYGMSLHIDGACPAFKSLSEGGYIYPPNYFGIEYQYIFEQFLYSRHPREPLNTRWWRLSQHRTWTKDPFGRVISFIKGSIFQDSNYYLKVSDDIIDKFIWGKNINGETFISAISKEIKNICVDPNGLLVLIPDINSDTELYNSEMPLHLWFVHSRHIIFMSDDEIIFKREETIWIINKVGYLRAEMDGHKNGRYAAPISYYSQEFDVLPYVIAGGILGGTEQKYYNSWLDGAKAFADEFVSAKSAQQLLDKEASHPFIIAASEECPDCAGGTIQQCGVCKHEVSECSCEDHNYNNYKLVKCPSCNGTGMKSRNPADWMVAPKEDMDKKLIQIVNPDVSINEYRSKANKDLYDGFISALHLSWIEQAQSGIAKERDAETRYQFVISISNDLFDRVISKLLQSLITLLSPDKKVEYIIGKPNQFSIKTSADLLNEYQLVTQANMPDYIRARHLQDYTDKQYGGDYAMIKKVDVILQLDKFATSTENEIKTNIDGGAANVRDWQFHRWLPTELDRLIRDNGRIWFTNAKIYEIESIVNKNFLTLPSNGESQSKNNDTGDTTEEITSQQTAT